MMKKKEVVRERLRKTVWNAVELVHLTITVEWTNEQVVEAMV